MGATPSKGESWEQPLQSGNHGSNPFKGGIMGATPSKGKLFVVTLNLEP